MRRSANGADDDRHGLRIREDDFTRAEPPAEPARVNLLIANPPYVRHHHIDGADKIRLKQEALRRLGIDVSRLAGLYVHFLLLSHEWMADGGVAAWLIPSEWMDVNYGAALKRYLLEQVSLLEIHLFDAADVQFGDALVSSSVSISAASPRRRSERSGSRPAAA